MSASLDCHLKFHDLTTFQCVHHVKFPSPILTAAVAVRSKSSRAFSTTNMSLCFFQPDDSFIAAGMSDGLVPRFKYLRYVDFSSRPGDVVVKQVNNPAATSNVRTQ
jgi:hypothetical protein